MKAAFSTAWNSSRKVRKQRKYRHNAPLNIKRKFLAAHLSKELITTYKKRNIPVRKGDTVKVMRGQFKGKTGKIIQVFPKITKIHVENVENTKNDGGKAFYPLNPSNVLITELVLTDPKRKEILTR